jgi:hypothetical protein
VSFDTIRPVLSGIIGAIIAGWLVNKMARWVPAKVGTKGRKRLLQEHKSTIRVANGLALLGIGIGILCYWSGWLSRNDWRGAGLGAGLMSILPVGYMVITNAARGAEAIKECLVSYAIAQKTPVALLFGLMGFLIVAGIVSAVSLYMTDTGLRLQAWTVSP